VAECDVTFEQSKGWLADEFHEEASAQSCSSLLYSCPEAKSGKQSYQGRANRGIGVALLGLHDVCCTQYANEDQADRESHEELDLLPAPRAPYPGRQHAQAATKRHAHFPFSRLSVI